ncbi:MAG: hypothetical protein DRI89_00980 [Bacteroidetes bacterium]|nr:MAG: hypothetical protein DRI89_00980 [Bacteroidota bacterium]
MKVFISLIIVFAGFQLMAQEEQPIVPVDPETGLIKFREVVDEKGTQNELFNRCIYWVNDFYANPTRVTTIRDYNSGRIEGKHNISIYTYTNDSAKKQAGTVDYVFNIELKHDKYRYTITDLKIHTKTRTPAEKWLNKNDPDYSPHWDEYLQQIADFFAEWSSSLKTKMKPEVKKTKDDW